MRAGREPRPGLCLAAHEEDELSQDCVLELTRNTDWNASVSCQVS